MTDRPLRIGIYGGSFNPVHKGHVSLAKWIVDNGIVDELWLMVSPLNPLKADVENEILPFETRMEMARIATENISGVRVSDFENSLPVPSYTISTLEALCGAYPQHSFCLVVGADNWKDFHRWHRWQEIVSGYDVFVYNRPGYDLEIPHEFSRVKLIDAPLYDISSTMIRKLVSEGKDASEYVDAKVCEYIKNKGLYQ